MDNFSERTSDLYEFFYAPYILHCYIFFYLRMTFYFNVKKIQSIKQTKTRNASADTFNFRLSSERDNKKWTFSICMQKYNAERSAYRSLISWFFRLDADLPTSPLHLFLLTPTHLVVFEPLSYCAVASSYRITPRFEEINCKQNCLSGISKISKSICLYTFAICFYCFH